MREFKLDFNPLKSCVPAAKKDCGVGGAEFQLFLHGITSLWSWSLSLSASSFTYLQDRGDNSSTHLLKNMILQG